ncbi:MAG: inositol monophosphatase family protein [Opitutales bacterium]
MHETLPELLIEVTRVAREAGEILRKGTGLRQVNFQDAKDVKLAADLESEHYCRKALATFSSYPIVGEEEGGDERLPEGSQRYWIVDPLDGTFNYLRELGLCCVSIGLMEGSTPLLGVIFDFNTGELFTAARGIDLKVNGEAVTPRWADSKMNAVLATGFPSSADFSTEAVGALIGQIQAFKKVRMIGSAALAAAYVATGRLDVYYESGCRWWDIAAGIALAEASGAAWRVTPVPDGPPFCVNIAIAGKREWLP